MDEAGHALVLGKPDRGAEARIIGQPLGEPGRGEPERARRHDQVHARRAGRQHLLPFGDLRVGRGARHDGDDERGADETPEFLRLRLVVKVWLVFEPDHQSDASGALARGALEHDETPRCELAMIGHARGDGEDGLEFFRGRTRSGHDGGRRGAAALQQGDRVVHGVPLRGRSELYSIQLRCTPPSNRLKWAARGPHRRGRGRQAAGVGLRDEDMRSIGRRFAGATVLALLAALSGPAWADPAAADGQATLGLSAVLNGQTAPLTGGVRWRVFSAKTEEDGSHALIVESNLAEPTLTLPPGDYVVHAAFGLASAAKRLTLGPEVRTERLPIAGGGLKIGGVIGDQAIDPSKLSLAIYVPVGRNPEGKLVDAKAKAGDIVGLPEGNYHVVSTYLDTVGGRFSISAAANTGKSAVPATPVTLPSNSIVNADIKVVSGKLVDVTLRHRCATLTLKLVNKPGGEALANTTFTVLTPGGDVIRELVGAFPALVLAEGEYVVIARHEAKTYQSTFEVHSAMDRDVEVVAQESAKESGKENVKDNSD